MRQLIESEWVACGCEVCGAGTEEVRTVGERSVRVAQRQHDYAWRHRDVQCTRCGFIFNGLRPNAGFLRDYYADCWPISSTSVSITPDFSVQARLEVLSRWIRPGAHLYEIGDKLGEFHAAVTAKGFSVIGDDVMAGSSERADWLDGLFWRDRAPRPPAAMREALDGVLAYYVMEHLANPQPWLRAMRSCLKDGGALVVEVPHFEQHPREGLMHEHFLYFTPESLAALVAAAGFHIVEVQESNASRPFGFGLVARRVEQSATVNAKELLASAAIIRARYNVGRDMLDAAADSLVNAARLAAAAALSGGPARVCFFGANQTASEIAAHLRPQFNGVSIPLVAYDNSDAKRGTRLHGFPGRIETPTVDTFDPSLLHVCIVCSRGWTHEIAEQIRSFRLPRVTLIDGANAQLLSVLNETETVTATGSPT